MAKFQKIGCTRKSGLLFRINGTILFTGVILCPFVASVVCVTLTISKYWENIVPTHCMVWNRLPTISAAISCCTPQRYIWRLLIALHISPRFMLAFMYYNHYMAFKEGKTRLYHIAVILTSSLHAAENLGLMLLSYAMSDDNYAIHRAGFGMFVLCSAVYMWLTVGVFNWSRSGETWNEKDLQSYKQKRRLAIGNTLALLLTMYLFFRHEWYCEPGMYSLCAFVEYILVLVNISFHATAMYEFGQGDLVFSEIPFNELVFLEPSHNEH